MKNDPSYNKINAVDVTNEYAKLKGITEFEADRELRNYGFLELIETEVKSGENYKNTTRIYDLSREAKKSLQSGKNIVDCVNDMLEKEKNEKYLKSLQVRDLEEKLNIMNLEQRRFWAEQKARNKQLTLIAIISALFSLFALLKIWFG